MMKVGKENMEEIQKLKPYLSNKTQEELDEILAYWEEIRKKWEIEKNKFWENHDRYGFMKLLKYKWLHIKELLWKYKYLDQLNSLEKERFVDEYLYDDMLYSWELFDGEEEDYGWFCYDDWEAGKAVIQEGITVDFSDGSNGNMSIEWLKKALDTLEFKEWLGLNLSGLWWEWLDVLVKMRLARWVTLNLNSNQLWDEWIKVMAENMELEEWMYLYLRFNEIWAMWAESISKMELKEWVTLDLQDNEIWDEWAKVIMENMKLKNWVVLRLYNNHLSKDMKDKLKKWKEERIKKWINCNVYV